MADKYRDFATLAKYEQEGVNFRIVLRRTQSPIAVVAPHGGSIEPGTSEIADAIAAASHSFYSFEGLRPDKNWDFHITSTCFDEPKCLMLVRDSNVILTIHGEHGEGDGVFVGGRDATLGNRIGEALGAAGFFADTHSDPQLQGAEPANLCNRGKSGAGVQLEISKGIRATMFKSLSRKGRMQATERLVAFARAVQEALQ